MLKAVIVYMQGTGGNLLSRSLSLANDTITALPKSFCKEQPTLCLSPEEKFKFYNNWNSLDWTDTEKSIGIWYHHNLQDFINYELSDLALIDQFHPVDFEVENKKKILWSSVAAWEQVILITWEQQHLNHITELARRKRKDLNHVTQLPTEIQSYHRLLAQHTGLTIAWNDMLEKKSYLNEVERLNQELKLDLNFSLVGDLWNEWKSATDLILTYE